MPDYAPGGAVSDLVSTGGYVPTEIDELRAENDRLREENESWVSVKPLQDRVLDLQIRLSAAEAERDRLANERDKLRSLLADDQVEVRDERDRLREALEHIAALAEGQEGRNAQTMMMHGFSPVKALGQARDIARQALKRSR